jgi:formiminotetrahydrofolate cyclodeaminase
VREDAEAYGAVIDARKRSHVDPNRSPAIRQAMEIAIAVPLAILQWSVEGMEALRELIPSAADHLAADLRVGVLLARAAGHAAISVIKTNMETLKDDPRLPELSKTLEGFEQRINAG